MAQITNSDSVYKELVEDSQEAWLYGLVAFAIFEEQRIEWLKHVEETTGQVPTSEEVENWYRQKPPGSILRVKGDAETALAAFINESVEEAVKAEQEKILESAILTEVRMARRFWPQFGINVAGGLVGAIVFSAILIILATILVANVSPISIYKSYQEQVIQESKSGEENSQPRSDEQAGGDSSVKGASRSEKQ